MLNPVPLIEIPTFSELCENRRVISLITRRTEKLIGRFGITANETDDIQQEIWLSLQSHWERYDPDKASVYTFVTRVTERTIEKYLRFRNAKKRDHRRIQSLHELVPTEEDQQTELGSTISYRELEQRLGIRCITEKQYGELRLDVQQVIATLSKEEQSLVKLLPTHSIKEICDQMKITRYAGKLLCKSIRKRFREFGF